MGPLSLPGSRQANKLGALLALAMAVELFFLTLSVGSEFHKNKMNRWQGLAATTGIALMLLLGAAGAFFFLRGASESAVAVFLSFLAGALLFLIAEELLVEAIEAEESLFSTAMLFAGFLVLLALKLFSQDAG